jgi:hypothetical protein
MIVINLNKVLKDLENAKKKPAEISNKIQREATFLALLKMTSHGRYAGSGPVGNPDLWKNSDAAPKGYVGGRHMANFRVKAGSIDTSTTEAIDASGKTSMKQLNNIDSLKPYGVVWISNDLPYSYRVMEAGHSTQTPKGSIAITAAEVKQEVKNKYS